MNEWVTDNLRKYQDIYLQHNGKELALSNCAIAMMKILNGLSEMTFTKFHRYEKKMLWGAMELFSKQCIQQIDIALNCQEVEQKKEYIVDIESSISEMENVYKNIMGAVSNVERQMFQSLSVDIKIHALSPKLCAFYSTILEKVVSMFREDGMEYAFILHPTLHSTIEAKVLLEKREQSGKVVIIYVSENVIEEFDLVSICLLHEAFHVLTKAERMREKRAQYFTVQMLEQVRRLVFQNVVFAINDHEIKEELTSHWFEGVREQMKEYAQRDKENKSFYGQSIKIEVENRFKEYLRGIDANLENIVMDIVFKNKKFHNYSEYRQQAQEVEENVKKIKSNIFFIMSENLITEIANQIMFIYREAYADIACILLLEIEPELYQMAFLHSIQFQYDTSYVDDAKCLRESLVTKTVAANISTKYQEAWKSYLNTPEIEGIQQEIGENTLPKEEFYDKIKVGSRTKGVYEEYLMKCANAFSRRLQDIEGIEEFRVYMHKVITGSPQQLLRDILGGDAI